MNVKIIVDGMGGDNAPAAIVDGVTQALRTFSDIDIILTGDPSVLGPACAAAGTDMSRVRIEPAHQIVLMTDEPVKALREKTDSSLVVALNLLAQDEHAMLISAGNTGALVAGSTLIVGRIKGVKRPSLAPVMPTKTGPVLLVDGGATPECKPSYLAQFGLMGSIYMNKVLGVPEPRVGLVNNGGEPGKGTALTREAYKLLKKVPIRFVGNVEGRDLMSGQYDVLVTDGFTGNVILKFVEGCSRTIFELLRNNIQESFLAKCGALLMKGAFRNLRKKLDYKEYGGALLLGVNGGVMKAHGSSDGRAMFAAIRTARTFLLGDVTGEIKREIAAMEKEKERLAAQRAAQDAAKGLRKKAAHAAGGEEHAEHDADAGQGDE